MNNPLKPTPNHSSSLRGRTEHLGEMRNARCPISYKVGYINRLPREVSVVWRSGVAVEIPRETTFSPAFEFIVTLDIEISPTLRANFEEFLSSVGEHSSMELKFIREEYIRALKSTPLGFIVLKMEYPVSLETLRANGDAVYLYEVDTVVSLGGIKNAPPHPFSDAGVHSRLALESGFLGDDKKFSIQMELVDNAGVIGERFLNVLGQVYRLEPKVDPNRKDGIYHVGSTPVKSSGTRNDLIAQWLGADQAEEQFKLYKSFEQARDFGDEATRQKKEAADAELMLVDMKSALVIKKADIDKEALELEKQRQANQLEFEEQQRQLARQREEEKAFYESQKLRRNDAYDDRSTRRKDESETFKHLPTIILGVGAFFMALGKFFALK